MLARTLSFAVSNNEGAPLFAGVIATMIYEYIKDVVEFYDIGTEVRESNLIDKDKLIRMGILKPWGPGIYMYNYMIKGGEVRSTTLPCFEYFDRLTDKWIVPEVPSAWEEMPTPQDEAPEQEEEAPWVPGYGYVDYNAGPSNWGYPQYPPGY